jgi:hypothetical protein
VLRVEDGLPKRRHDGGGARLANVVDVPINRTWVISDQGRHMNDRLQPLIYGIACTARETGSSPDVA